MLPQSLPELELLNESCLKNVPFPENILTTLLSSFCVFITTFAVGVLSSRFRPHFFLSRGNARWRGPKLHNAHSAALLCFFFCSSSVFPFDRTPGLFHTSRAAPLLNSTLPFADMRRPRLPSLPPPANRLWVHVPGFQA